MAIPHAILDGLPQSCCIFLRLSNALEFDAVDAVPVDIVVLLLSPPAKHGQSLNVLSCIARKLPDEKLAASIRAAKTAEEIYVLITQA
jgi:nitrogen PTS system EIIA component